MFNYTAVSHEINPCGYAFVVEDGAYNFSSSDFMSFQKRSDATFPVVLDWAVANLTCQQAMTNLTGS